MTTINLQASVPAMITGMQVAGSVGGAILQWNASDSIYDRYQVWYNTSSTITGAVQLATVETNHFSLSGLTPGINYWFFVRAINQFGVVGPFQQHYLVGAHFKTLMAGIRHVPVSGTVFTSVNAVRCKVWYTTSAGVATSVGPSFFATATSLAPGSSWASPVQALTIDGAYATSNTSVASETLAFPLSDISIPDDAIVTGVEFTLNGKTLSASNCRLFADIGGFGSTQFPLFTNSLDQVIVVGGSNSKFDLDLVGFPVTTKLTQTDDIASSAVTNITVSTASVAQENSTQASGTQEISNVSSVTFDGNDYPVNIVGNNQFSWTGSLESPFGYMAGYGIHSIQDVTAGGSDSWTAYTTFAGSASISRGGTAWSNLSSAVTANDVFATVTTGTGGVCDAAVFYNWDVSGVPAGATIRDIVVKVKCKVNVAAPTSGLLVGLTTTATTDPLGLTTGSYTDYKYIVPTTTNLNYVTQSVVGGDLNQLGTWNGLFQSGKQQRLLTLADLQTLPFGVVIAPTAQVNGTIFSIDEVAISIYYTTKQYSLYEFQELSVYRLHGTGAEFDSRQQPFQINHTFTPTAGRSYKYSSDWVTYKNAFCSSTDYLSMYSGRQNITLMELKR